MSFNSILKIFLPKDKTFYDLFEQITTSLIEMSSFFGQAVKEKDPEKSRAALRIMKEFEHKNDTYTHRIFMELGKNFITPFDREDIHALAISLDDVADYMYACYNRMVIYDIVKHDVYMEKMVDIIDKSVIAVGDAVHELRNMKNLDKLQEALIMVNSLENQADDILDQGLNYLFKEVDDAITLIKYKEVYETLELITDKCEDASDVIESIVIKYT